ncbi:uncharacterized protein LOC114961752 [Acropora millepora]|uniref:uncharacterized protein LOC114961752 n=1 Tax=Acropora millepora TaxID=45264 RepID=UPI001CF2A2B0|nr:uncharacterized protein LOC114961752 [Acropora millepora]
MENWRVILLTGCVFLAFCGVAGSIKCYFCQETTKAECARNQTPRECNANCVDVKLQIGNESLAHIKDCFLPGTACSIFNKHNISQCTETSCASDYCNGPIPTTLSPSTVPVTSPLRSESSSTENPSRSSKKPEEKQRAAANLATSASGLIIFSVAVIKTVEMLS